MPNTDFSRFTSLPADSKKPRSTWMMPARVTSSLNAGKLVPVGMPLDVMPGDTISLDQGLFMRMSTPIHPVMDDCFIDVHWYFVPLRLVWDNYDKFFGANDDPWAQETEYQIPQIASPIAGDGYAPGMATFPTRAAGRGFAPGTVADYMGLPILVPSPVNDGVPTCTVGALRFRAYAKIWNDYYRDENLMKAVDIPKDDVTRQGASNYGNPLLTAVYGGQLLPVCKYHDYFTSALPEPQKGPEVIVPLQSQDGSIIPTGDLHFKFGGQDASIYGGNTGEAEVMTSLYAQTGMNNPGGPLSYESGLGLSEDSFIGPTINALREAFAIQRIYELDGLFGSRYNEGVRAHFGVTVPDYRAQRAEYLGGTHLRVNMSQVLQTSSTDETSPQGNTAAFSATGDRSHMFTYSVVEHGFIMGMVMVRNVQSYQQGINRAWLRKRRFDFYTPELANIGNQPVYNDEIYHSIDPQLNGETFGFQEAWADYRYIPALKTGAMRSNRPGGGLDVWHYADYYDRTPVLGPEWIEASKNNIDRTLAVSSELEDQFIYDFDLNFKVVRPMPVYSTPGGLFHH